MPSSFEGSGRLVAAVREGEKRFALGPVELELQVVVTKDFGGQAGIAVWVVTVGGKSSRVEGTTHSVKLTLTPVGPAGKGQVVIRSELAARPT